jgi:Na+/melibiose symporter-like transporter
MPRFDPIRASFGAAHFSKSLVWSFVDLLFAYFLYNVVRLPAEQTGHLLFGLLLFAALADLGVGVALSHFRVSCARVLLLHLIGALATGVTLFAQFDLAQRPGVSLLLIGLLFRLVFSLYDVAQTALTSLLPENDASARRYVQLRTALSAAARLVVTAASLWFTQLPGAILQTSMTLVLSLFAIAMISTAAILLYCGRDFARRDAYVRSQTRRLVISRELALLLLAFIVSVAFFATMNRLVIFTPRVGPWLLFIFSIGTLAGPIVAFRLEDQLGWRAACIVSAALATIAGDLLAFAPGTAAALAYGLGLGALGSYLWEWAARLVSRHAAATGERIDAMVFALVIFSIKIAVAGGSLILGSQLEGFAAGDLFAALTLTAITTASGLAVGTLLLMQRRVAVTA